MNLLLRHSSGRTSSSSFTLRAPAALDSAELVLWGSTGQSAKPVEVTPGAIALQTAIETLVAMAETGVTAHPCDSRTGAEIVRILQSAEQQLGPIEPTREDPSA